MADVPNPQNPPDDSAAPDSDAPKINWESSEFSDAERARLREMEILAQARAEEDGQRAPTGLIMLMLAPVLMIALPLLLFLVLRGMGTAGNPAPPTTPQAGVVAPSTSTSASVLAWNQGLETAQQLARQSNKNLMVDFYSDT